MQGGPHTSEVRSGDDGLRRSAWSRRIVRVALGLVLGLGLTAAADAAASIAPPAGTPPPPPEPPTVLPGLDDDADDAGDDDAPAGQGDAGGDAGAPPSGDAGSDPSADAGTAADGGDDGSLGKLPSIEPDKVTARASEVEAHLRKGLAAQRKGRHDVAIPEFTAALELEPRDATALLGRARSRKAQLPDTRCPRRALRDLLQLEDYDPRGAWIEQRQIALQWLSLCPDKRSERLGIARSLAEDEVGSTGRPDEIRFTLAKMLYDDARDEPESAARALREDAQEELERYRAECKVGHRDPDPAALRLLAEILQEREEIDPALSVYRDLLVRAPDSEAAEGVDQIIEDLELEQTLRELEKTQGWKPTAAAEAAYERGVAALQAGSPATAQAELDDAIAESPWFPRAYHARGVVHARTGRFALAVSDLKRAVRMDRSDYEAQIKLGLIYKKEFAGAEDEAAIEHLSAALRLRPDLHRLHLLLGELYARTDREKAREHYSRFRRLAEPEDPDVDKARRALEDLERRIREDEAPEVSPPAETSLRSLDPRLQRLINEAYLRGTEHQDWQMAEKILLEARDQFPEEPAVLNELARVAYAEERWGDARQYWETSLGMDERQMEVHERLGLLLREDLPDRAVEHLHRAADLGSLTARYVLADLLWDQTRPLDASEQLDLYLQAAGDYDLHHDRAIELRDEIDRRFLQFYLVAGAILVIATVVPAWRIYRRYRGSSLAQLLERDPKSFPQVARILSLIRHEILKHNTAFLADVGTALEVDAPDADMRATVLARRMFGDGVSDSEGRRLRDRKGRPAGGIYGRFLGYLAELEKVARAHRVTLNLYRKDPIFRPMIRAFEELFERADSLRASDRLRQGRRLELSRTLSRCGTVLGRQAFERLSGLIRELCVVTVDPALMREVYEQVAGEEQFAGARLGAVELYGGGTQVRIFRTDLEDILANVIRNSLRSSVQYATPPVVLGIDLVVEQDEITGLSSLAIRVKDRSPEQLSNEMLRGRYVERGMGITVDLLSRYDGAISVEGEPGWSKAVVLRFFTVEDDGSSIDAEAAQ